MNISWIYLILAIILEVFATTMMKLSNGLNLLIPTVCMFIGYILCFTFLSFSLKHIDVSIAYAVWCAMGIVLIALIGMLFFNESMNSVKLLGLLFIIIGVVTLKLYS